MNSSDSKNKITKRVQLEKHKETGELIYKKQK